jgi:hypothetical protein
LDNHLIWVKVPGMESELRQRCMVCAKFADLSGGICQACADKIRGQAQGKRREVREKADRELRKHGITPRKDGKPQ